MHKTKAMRQARPVQVQFARASTLVEYVPAKLVTPRAEKLNQRLLKAQDSGDFAQMHAVGVELLSEVLTGWSFGSTGDTPGKPSRAALEHMPAGWIAAALTAVGKDTEEFQNERGDDVS
ncbi:MAG: hypothetical protein IT328_27950 [Caldilineaceae bacterium]|nr:hypothetical protein [Caldilineaceae bacterium]